MCNGRGIDRTGHAKKQNNNGLAEPLLLFWKSRAFFRLFHLRLHYVEVN